MLYTVKDLACDRLEQLCRWQSVYCTLENSNKMLGVTRFCTPGRGRLNRHFEGRGWLNRRFGGFRRLPAEWARINTKSGYTNVRQRGQIGDSEVKDIFSTMRLVGLNYYVCQGKTQSEVAPGRNCVPKLLPRDNPLRLCATATATATARLRSLPVIILECSHNPMPMAVSQCFCKYVSKRSPQLPEFLQPPPSGSTKGNLR